MKKFICLALIIAAFQSCNKHKTLTEASKKQVIQELHNIEVLDQKFAGIPPQVLMDTYGPEKAWDIFEEQRDSVGVVNQERIKKLYETYGYLGEKMVGKEAATHFWLPIQHADNDEPFQQQMLIAMGKEIEKGSKDKAHYAMLEDRINVNLKQPQRFGSQLTYNKLGQAIPKIGLVDSLRVDSLRNAFDLPDFKTYYNQMTIMHFEMNKSLFVERGINEPLLYQ
ncbi:DUF6624 domain-containing protein [Gaetbulibacter aestuarii]|uniref:DUF6624 domain-containing protein n=1 Tax=Gaetbulibacter aestuarii TaxID=1502358 RepID=A0ABW7MXI6_9FLAO